VVKPDPSGGCILKSSDDEVDGPLLGYLAEVSSRGRRQRGHVTCGTQQSPWLVAARPGQRLRFTLMDFTTTSSDAPLDVNHDDVAVQSQTIALRHANDGRFDPLHSPKLARIKLSWTEGQNYAKVLLIGSESSKGNVVVSGSRPTRFSQPTNRAERFFFCTEKTVTQVARAIN